MITESFIAYNHNIRPFETTAELGVILYIRIYHVWEYGCIQLYKIFVKYKNYYINDIRHNLVLLMGEALKKKKGLDVDGKHYIVACIYLSNRALLDILRFINNTE